MDPAAIRSHPLGEIIALARKESSYYRDAYAGLPARPELTDLPVVDPTAYWQAHTDDRRNILTAPFRAGRVLNSGGSTGSPKFLYITPEEWASAAAMTARSFVAGGIRDGDRVANLFAAGNLYASFLHATSALEICGRELVQVPIGYFGTPAEALRFVRIFDTQVILGTPTYMASIVDLLVSEGLHGLDLRLLLYAGEAFTADQRAHLQAGVPGLDIRSAGYASVDAGPMAFADGTCAPGEHRAFDGASILEIMDEDTGERILETGRPGRLVLTNLTRRLMPMLRYPSGDRGEWRAPVGAPDRRFMLLGRAEEQVRVAAVNLSAAETRTLLEPFKDRLGITQFQLLVTRESQRDLLTLRLVSQASATDRAGVGEEIVRILHREKPLLDKLVAGGTLHRTRVEWISPAELIVNKRTGKTLTVIDQRTPPE